MENDPNELFNKPVIEETKNSGRYIWPVVSLIIIVIAIYSLITGISSNRKEAVEKKDDTKKEMTESALVQKQVEELSKVTLLTDFGNTVTNGKISAFAQKKITTTGNFKRGFLHVVASLGDKALDPYSDVYLKLGAVVENNWSESGGHLIEKESLETSSHEDKTELLYDLTKVVYKESYQDSNDKIISADWLELLNKSEKQFLTTFTSTESAGLIQEVDIYYECEEGSECSIEVSN